MIDQRAFVLIRGTLHDVPQAVADTLEREGLVTFRDDPRGLAGRYIAKRGKAPEALARLEQLNPPPAVALAAAVAAMLAEVKRYDDRLNGTAPGFDDAQAPDGADYSALHVIISAHNLEALLEPFSK